MDAQINELVLQAKEGNAEAFGELYELYQKELYRYACCVIGSDSLAQDAVQEAVLSAYEQIRLLKKTESFKNWLFKILLNICKRYYLQSERAKFVIDIDDEGSRGVQPAASSPELSTELKDALGKLNYQEREIVLLSVLGNYRSYEIAGILDCPAVTVRSKLKRALKKLRTQLEYPTEKGGENDEQKE